MKRAFRLAGLAAVSAALIMIFANALILLTTRHSLVASIDALPVADAVMIPGAAVRGRAVLSNVLRDRADTALDVYRAGKAHRILVSGDHGTRYYDEVNAVKMYLLTRGVPPRDIFMDHAGFSTYDSLYRARAIFQVTSIVIATQRFHLARALFIGRSVGLDISGIAADRRIYDKWHYYQVREALARCKAIFDVLRKARPRYLGPPIPITGDGRSSWD